jgi:nicotinamidase-related amidase
MTGLLIVDAQNGLFNGLHQPQATLGAMKHLLEKARSAHVSVFFTQDRDVGEPESHAFAIHPTLEPRDGETVIQKNASDAFHGTPLEAMLREHSIQRVVIAGLKTPACITATTLGAIYRGFNVTPAQDAHSTDDTEELPADRVIAYTNEFLYGYGSRAHGYSEGHPNVTVLRSSEVVF